MSNSSANRAPLVLSLVILLGVGGRWLRGEHAPATDTPVARVALDSQLARVERAGRSRDGQGNVRRPTRRSRGGTPQDSTRGRARTPSRRSRPDSQARSVVRTERTPIGAVSSEALARLEATRADAASGNRGEGKRETRRSVRASRASRVNEAPAALVDLESASASEIERLPRVGPSLARRIVEDRVKHGPFRSLDGLQRVRGVGPGVASQLRGRVTFGGTGRP